jgi:hypothetical protein
MRRYAARFMISFGVTLILTAAGALAVVGWPS